MTPCLFSQLGSPVGVTFAKLTKKRRHSYYCMFGAPGATFLPRLGPESNLNAQPRDHWWSRTSRRCAGTLSMARQIVTIIVTGCRSFCLGVGLGDASKRKQDEADRFSSVCAAQFCPTGWRHLSARCDTTECFSYPCLYATLLGAGTKLSGGFNALRISWTGPFASPSETGY